MEEKKDIKTITEPTLSNICFKVYTITISLFLNVVGLMFGVFLFKTQEERNSFILLSLKTILCLMVFILIVVLISYLIIS